MASTPITIVSLNIRHGQGMPRSIRRAYTSFTHSRESMEENAKHLAHQLKKITPTPDIICIQESNAMAYTWPDVTDIIRERLGYQHIATSPRKIFPHNNAIISRLPFASVLSRQYRKRKLLQTANPVSIMTSLNRGFISVDIEGVGTVINTHLDPFDPRVRRTQIRELLTLIDSSRPTILAGDLNPASFNEKGLRLISAKGFHTVPEITKKQFYHHGTWPHVKQARMAPLARLDYIFTTDHLTITSTSRFDTRLSDHSGLIATIERAT